MKGEITPGIAIEEADPLIGGLRTWPHTPPNKPDYIRKLTNHKAGIQKEQKNTNKNSKKHEIRERIIVYKHSHNLRTYVGVTHMKWHRDHTSTDARRDTIRKEKFYALSISNRSQTHIF